LWRNLFKVVRERGTKNTKNYGMRPMKKIVLTLWTLVAAIFVTTEAIAQDGYRIRSGDVLAVEVIQDPNLNREVLVLPDGSISFPFAGTVAAGGLTTGQVQAQIAQGISPNFAVQPTVFVTVRQVGTPTGVGSARTIDVFYLGEVNAPGMVEVNRGTTLLQGLSLGGGFTQFRGHAPDPAAPHAPPYGRDVHGDARLSSPVGWWHAAQRSGSGRWRRDPGARTTALRVS
jgi:polysaccharide export outer membrane protein